MSIELYISDVVCFRCGSVTRFNTNLDGASIPHGYSFRVECYNCTHLILNLKSDGALVLKLANTDSYDTPLERTAKKFDISSNTLIKWLNTTI